MDKNEILKKMHSSTEFSWEKNSYIRVEQLGKMSFSILANREGLISLARQLKKLAKMENETNIFYDSFPGDLESGSAFLEIKKINIEGRK